ncbi:uncharacterized protein [Amphiura filiformis]|uniref:uncharacterized protein n=1 Tax=Amphiura filiformis TaxID=82378 RepID=UPI003B21244D
MDSKDESSTILQIQHVQEEDTTEDETEMEASPSIGAYGGGPSQPENGTPVDGSQGNGGTQIQKQVETELTCAVCLGLFETPRALPCQHTYCENCIKGLALSSSANGTKIRCPECRKQHDITDGDVTNFKVNYKIKSLCDWMRGRQPGKCPNHLEEFDHICHVCKEPICKKCTITTHNGHDCVSIVQFAENMMTEVRIRKEALRKAKQRVEKSLCDLNRNKESAMQGLQQHIRNIKLAIDQAQQDLDNKITDAYHRKEANLKRQESKFDADLKDLDGFGREDVLRELQMPASLPLMWNTLQTKTTKGSYAPCESSTLMVKWDQALLQQLTQEIKLGEVKMKPLAVASESFIEVNRLNPDTKDLDIIIHLRDRLGADAQSDITADVVAMVYTPGGKRGQLCEISRVPPEGNYRARFSPRYVGKYKIEVKVTGDVVKNCPYPVMVGPDNKMLANRQTSPSKMYEPHDIQVMNGDYIIADKSNNRVVITGADFEIKSKLPTPEGDFKPYSIAVVGDEIFVTDNGTGRVVVYKDRVIVREFGQEDLERPTGIAIFKNKVYVADWQQSCIHVFGMDGGLQKTLCNEGKGVNNLDHPWMITFNTQGQLLVADGYNKRIQILEPERSNEVVDTILVRVKETALIPRGIAVDVNNTIFVTAMERVKGIMPCLQCVVVFTQGGYPLGIFGDRSGFHWPRGIAVINNAGDIPMALVTNNHCIKEFVL